MLIGGTGRDSLTGGDGDDLLIAAATACHDDMAALNAVLTEWSSVASYLDRVNHLKTGSGIQLNSTSIIDDANRDTLTGDSGQEWFISGLGDLLRSKLLNELSGL